MRASRTDTERAAMVLRRGTGRGGSRALLASDVFEGLWPKKAFEADHGKGSGRHE